MRRLAGLTRSLAVRLVLAILAVEFVVVLGGLFIYGAVLPEAGANLDIAAAVLAIQRSVQTDAAGDLVLVPNAELRALLAGNPTLRVAVFDRATGRVAAGSEGGLTEVLRVSYLNHVLTGSLDTEEVATPLGPRTALLSAERGSVHNVPQAALFFFRQSVYWLGPAAGVLAVIAVLVTWLTLRPVHAAARAVRGVGVRSLSARVPEADIPREVAPFVRSVNELLGHIEADVGRQRRFIASAAHELRTPVAIQKARVEAMPAGPLRDELTADTRRIATLVEQLLAMARLGDYRLPLDQEIDLAAVTRGVLADMAPLAIGQGRDLALHAEAGTSVVRGNRQAVEVALINVIDNALRVEPDGGTVEVRTGPGPVVRVTDHGPGLTEEEQQRVFEPFWRKTPSSKGTGLGLSIVRECARLHGGGVTVDSRVGRGTTFTLSFGPA